MHLRDLRFLAIEKILVLPGNPRVTFEEEELRELARSIEELGVFQPVVVASLPGGLYQLLAGERRLRASKLANQMYIPAVIVEGTEEELQTLRVGENLWRVSLNPLEEAIAFEKMQSERGYSLTELAKSLKKSQRYVRSRLALLTLPQGLQELVASGTLSLGIAVELVKVKDHEFQARLASEGLARSLTVKQVATRVRRWQTEARARVEREGMIARRDALVARLASEGRVVLTLDTFDGERHHHAHELTFEACGPCPRKALFVTQQGAIEECCVDPQCFKSLSQATYGQVDRMWRERQQQRAAAIAGTCADGRIEPIHWVLALWCMLRVLASDGNAWREQHEIPLWESSANGREELVVLADWTEEELLHGLVSLSMAWFACTPNRMLCPSVKSYLSTELGVPRSLLFDPTTE